VGRKRPCYLAKATRLLRLLRGVESKLTAAVCSRNSCLRRQGSIATTGQLLGKILQASMAIRHVSLGSLPIVACRSFLFMITTAICRMDPASVALAEGLEPNEPRTYAALSNRHQVPRTTLWNRAHGLPSIEEKAKH
jgi:hypothetical protein